MKRVRIVFAEDYRICCYCGRKYAKVDAIRIANEQGYNSWRPYWGYDRMYCGYWCNLLNISTLKPPYTHAKRHAIHRKNRMLRYVLKYANTDVMLGDVTYL